MIRALRQRLTKLFSQIATPYPTDNTTAIQRHGMRVNWWSSVISSVSGAFYTDFVTIYMLALGATAATVGLRASINSAAALAAPLLGAWLVEQTGKRKALILLWPGFISRLMLLLMALIPFLAQGKMAVTLFVVLVALQAFSDTLAGPAANSLLGDIVPIAVRGRYVGAQMIAGLIVRIAVLPLAGMLIKRVGGLAGYQLAWCLAALIGFLATWLYAQLPEPQCVESQGKKGDALHSFVEGWRVFSRDRRFVAFCAAHFIWNFGVSFAGPFFQVHMVEDLGFNVETIALLATITTPVNVLGYWLAGHWVDRAGAQRAMSVSMLFVPLLPVIWIFARSPWHVGLIQSYGFLAWAGFHVASTPLILAITPPEYRSRYIAIYNTFNAVASMISPLAAGWVYSHWGFTANCVGSAIGRGLGGFLFLLLVKTGSLGAATLTPVRVKKAPILTRKG